MEYFPEDVLRDYGDEPTNLMLDLWHKECVKYFNNDIEVIMADRRHNPQLRDIPGIINLHLHTYLMLKCTLPCGLNQYIH